MALVAGVAAIALTVSGCSQEEGLTGNSTKKNNAIVATFGGDDASTRTTVNTNNKIVWTANDAFSLFYTQNGIVGSDKFTLREGEENKIASIFDGNTTDGVSYTYAAYPKQDGNNLSLDADNVVSLTLPTSMEYTANSNGPMFAKVTNQSNLSELSFKHLAALIRVTVGNIPTSATTFTLTADKNIAGTCTADLDDAEPLLAVKDDSNAGKSVTVTFTNAIEGSKKVFYIPIPAGTYNLIAEMSDGTHSLFQKEWRDVAIARADLCYASLNITAITGSTADVTVLSSSVNDINAELALQLPDQTPTSGSVTTNVALNGTINTGNDVTPLVIPIVKNSNINLSFADIPNTSAAPLVLNDNTSSSSPSVDAVNTLSVAIPKSNDASAPSLAINMPRTTVELAASNETAIYNKVVAKTARQTLVVRAGVTVKELQIAGGNLEVYGTIEKLSLADGYSTLTQVASFGAADIKEIVVSENFNLKSTWDGISKVLPTNNNIYTAAQLANFCIQQVPAESNKGKLDETITENVALCTDVDLNGKPWTGMVLGAGKTFEGNRHTVSNVSMMKFAMKEQSIYTPEACVGFFAETHSASVVKDITIDGFTVAEEAAEAKWVGALVGVSSSRNYINCHATNVKIESESANAYRLGGLIGFISGGDNNTNVVLEDCSAKNVTIKGSFCIGGLVGSLQGGERIFKNCKVENPQLSINANSSAIHGAYSGTTFYAPYKWWGGYMSKFVGEANCSVIRIDDACSVLPNQGFTASELESFGYNDIAQYSYKGDATQDEMNAAIANAKHYKLENGNIFLPACVDKGSIYIGEKQLTNGLDYNKFTEINTQL